jgi:cytochrome c oxidase accessory protein FixG
MNVKPEIDRIDVEAVNSKEKRSLYAVRKKVFPKRVSGTFRTLKWWITALTLAIYYVTPWLRWDRGDFAPDQAVLVDMANRRFYFFFIQIWPQEFYYIAGLLVMAGIGLFLVTSTVGRAWCGYTCPQTVWVDFFLVVERWVEGDRNARIKLDKGVWTTNKFVKRISKHFLWILIAISTGGAWIFYFADAPTLIKNLLTGNAPFVAYSTIAILTATTYIFAGFMREQVCTYMCPWPRIQGAMLDEDSLVVTYNDWRGEPRGRHRKKTLAAGQVAGDCVDCNACVAVCPMGIDIRDGQQLECITCALCIDACNGVMDKLGMPKSLISYTTLNDFNENASGRPAPTTWRSFIRPRTFIYFAFWVAIGLAMLFMLLNRDRMGISVLHDRNPIFVQLADGSIRNGYTVKILNMELRPRGFQLDLKGLEGATMVMSGSDAPPSRQITLDVPADKLRIIQVYVTAARAQMKGETTPFQLIATDVEGEETAVYDAAFKGPDK